MPITITLAHPIARRIMPSRPLIDRFFPTRGLDKATKTMVSLSQGEGVVFGFGNLQVAPKEEYFSRYLGTIGPVVSTAEHFPYNELISSFGERLDRAGIGQILFKDVSNDDIRLTFKALLTCSPEKLQKKFAERQDVTIGVESLPVDIDNADKTYAELKQAVKLLRRKVKPNEYADRSEIREIIKNFSTTILQLMLLFKDPLDIETSGLEVSETISSVILERENVTRNAVLTVMATVYRPKILQKAFAILAKDLSTEEVNLILLFNKKTWVVYEHNKESDQIFRDIVDQAVDRPATSRDTLKKVSMGKYEHIRLQTCLKALNRIFDQLSRDEVFEYFKHGSPAIVRKRLFEHPSMTDNFTREYLFNKDQAGPSYHSDEADVGAFRRLRASLAPEDLGRLVAGRALSLDLKAMLINDPDLPPEARFALMKGVVQYWRNYCRYKYPMDSRRESILINGLNFVGDSLTREEIEKLYPSGSVIADRILVVHPNYSKDFRLKSLRQEIWNTFAQNREVVLVSLGEAEKVFDPDDWEQLIRVIVSRQVTQIICEKILFTPHARIEVPILAEIILRQYPPSERKSISGSAPPGSRVVGYWHSGRDEPYESGDIIGCFTDEDIAKILKILDNPKFIDLKQDVIEAIRAKDSELADFIMHGKIV